MINKMYKIKYVAAALLIYLFHSLAFCEVNNKNEPNQYIKGEIIANILNVRARPAVKYEVVCQLKKGDIINIKKTQDEWLGIGAPIQAEAWISSMKLDAENKTTEETLVYSGPGTIFSTYTTLAKNHTVEELRRHEGKWVKIVPPEHAIVWVHGNYVRKEITQKSSDPASATIATVKTQTSKKITDQKQSGTQVDKKVDSNPKAISEKNIVAVEGKGTEPTLTYIGKPKTVEKSGTIIKRNDNHKPCTQSNAISIDSQYYPLAYLNSEKFNLDNWAWEKVNLTGRQRWLKGWPRPIIEIESMEPIKGED